MRKIPKRVQDRVQRSAKRFQTVLQQAQKLDVNESDTVTIVADILQEMFGFDKYTEVTSEQAIRGTFCDLATKINDDIKYLIEVKAVGISLRENHLRQATNYGATQGIPWVVLTNGIDWQIHQIKWDKQVTNELVCEFNMVEINPRSDADLEKLFLLCREGHDSKKAAIAEYHAYKAIVSRYTLAALLSSEPVISVVKRELRRLAPDLKPSDDEILRLVKDTIKREVAEHEDTAEMAKRLKKASQKKLRQTTAKPKAAQDELPEEASQPEA